MKYFIPTHVPADSPFANPKKGARIKDHQEYISKVAKTERDACSLIDAGFDYVCDFDNARIFRKKKY